MRSIYLDNSATTKVYPEVAEEMCKTMMADYGNPSAKHLKRKNTIGRAGRRLPRP